MSAQPTFEEWLKRGEARPKKRTLLRSVSKKREAQNRIYAKKRKQFLASHPFCMAQDIIELYTGVGPRTHQRSVEIHHMKKPKCKYLNDESTWLAVSRFSHEWIEKNKKTARTLGLLK